MLVVAKPKFIAFLVEISVPEFSVFSIRLDLGDFLNYRLNGLGPILRPPLWLLAIAGCAALGLVGCAACGLTGCLRLALALD